MAEKISPAWRKQFHKEEKFDRDFKYAEGPKSLKGGISNPKNWPGGKWEMLHDPYENRKKLEGKKVSSEGTKRIAKKPTGKKKSGKRIATK